MQPIGNSIDPVVLFSKSYPDGNIPTDSLSGKVTLNLSAANFSELRIFFLSNDGFRGSVSVLDPDGKTVSLLSCTLVGTTSPRAIFKGKTVKIEGTKIDTNYRTSGDKNYYDTFEYDAKNQVITVDDYIAIYQVIGIR